MATPTPTPTPPPPRTSALRTLRRPVVVLPVLGALVVAIVATVLLWPAPAADPTRVALSEAVATIGGDEVVFARIDDQRREVLLVLGDPTAPPALVADEDGVLLTPEGPQVVAAFNEGYGPELAALLLATDVPFTGDPRPGPDRVEQLVLGLLPVIVIVGFLVWFMVNRGGVGKMGASSRKPAEIPTTRFDDVAGADEVVEELREVVAFLHDPTRFAASGASVPRGFLLEGPPGTGKTLLARAVAGEAGVAFFSLSGSEFVELFVGVGAARVRSVFAKARKQGRAIVFIDEIDAIGKARGNGPGNGANDEREATLNQLLVEMDGFTGSSVLILAATNRADVLDAALLRPGRFDRRITVPAPDRAGRTQILELHAAGRTLGDDVDLVDLARRTPGMTGADLAALVNAAALTAARAGSTLVTSDHLDEALATTMLGRARRSAVTTERDRTITAWHEAGHTLAALLLPDADDPVSVTIVPRGHAGGVTWMGGNDNAFLTRREALAKLVTAMAGRAAEELLLDGEYTQGAASDLEHATRVATAMVTRWGMSPLGVTSIDPEQLAGGPLATAVHEAVATLLDAALADARQLLRDHQDLLTAVADELLLEETVHLDDLRRLQHEVTGVAASA